MVRVDGRVTMPDGFRAEAADDFAKAAGIREVGSERFSPHCRLTQLFEVQGLRLRGSINFEKGTADLAGGGPWSGAERDQERSLSSVQLYSGKGTATVRVDRVGACDRLVEADSVEVIVQSVSCASPGTPNPTVRARGCARVECVWAPQRKAPDDILQRADQDQVVLLHRFAATQGARGSRVLVGRFGTQVFHHARSAKRMAVFLASDRWLVEEVLADLSRVVRFSESLSPCAGNIIARNSTPRRREALGGSERIDGFGQEPRMGPHTLGAGRHAPCICVRHPPLAPTTFVPVGEAPLLGPRLAWRIKQARREAGECREASSPLLKINFSFFENELSSYETKRF